MTAWVGGGNRSLERWQNAAYCIPPGDSRALYPPNLANRATTANRAYAMEKLFFLVSYCNKIKFGEEYIQTELNM